MRFLTRQLLLESFRSFSRAERAVFYISASVFVASGLILAVRFAALYTIRVPAPGGTYTEAVVGGPRFINPALAPANDADRDLVRLLYSGLMQYNEKGVITPDLAESYTVSTDSKVFTFTLKAHTFWHDNIPLTIDDVIFTIRLIQNSDYQSPLRFAWQGVKIEKRDERTIALTLPNPYEPFLAYTTVGILPRHMWQDVSPQAFALSDGNLKPIGSGPFRLQNLDREKDGRVAAVTLERNTSYYQRPPYLEQVTLKFFEDREEAIATLTSGDSDGLYSAAPQDVSYLDLTRISLHRLALPRTYAVFFNQQQSAVLAHSAVREALDFATDRQSIVQKVYHDEAEALYGPLPSAVFGYAEENIVRRTSDLEKAKTILEKSGWKLREDGIRELREVKKEEQIVGRAKVIKEIITTTTLEFSLLTANLAELEKTAELLESQWKALGAKVNLEITGVADIQGERVRPRQYDAVLFGEVVGLDPDPYSFWHSSQRRDPGLNLALYQNPKVDRALEEARQTSDNETRKKKLADFQKFIADDIPAIFLVSPTYLYPVSNKVQNIKTTVIPNPAERFSNVTHWYMRTKRVWR